MEIRPEPPCGDLASIDLRSEYPVRVYGANYPIFEEFTAQSEHPTGGKEISLMPSMTFSVSTRMNMRLMSGHGILVWSITSDNSNHPLTLPKEQSRSIS